MLESYSEAKVSNKMDGKSEQIRTRSSGGGVTEELTRRSGGEIQDLVLDLRE